MVQKDGTGSQDAGFDNLYNLMRLISVTEFTRDYETSKLLLITCQLTI